MAEDVYEKLNDLRDQVVELRQRVERVDRTAEDNRALLEALAREQGIDVETVLAEASIEEAESTDTTDTTAAETESTATDATGDSDGPTESTGSTNATTPSDRTDG